MRQVRGSRLLAWGVGVAAVAVLLVIGLGHSGRASARPAPSLPRERLAGPPVTLATLRGRPALVTFWASWCGPCSKEAPELERFAQSQAGKGRLVAVDWSDPLLDEARKFIGRNRWTFSVLRDEDGTVGLAYGLIGLPTTFVLNSHGQIVEQLTGPQTAKSLGQALANA
jgi:cytochrome c biogenesis protein CcmG, thiol:disulfide interchange protein DsbE